LTGLLWVVGRRLWSHLALMLAIAAGFVVAISLVVSIPVYAEAVGYRVLRDELSHNDSGGIQPPFSFMYRYLGSQHGLTGWDEYAKLDDYMRQRVESILNLPVEQRVRYVGSDRLPLLPSNGAGSPLMWVTLAFASDLDQHIQIVDGRMPQVTKDGPVEVLITEALASKLGFQVGEEYLALGPKDDRAGKSTPVRITGVWRPKNEEDPYWFYTPPSFDETLFMPEESFTTRVVARDPKPIYVALWYFVTDGSGIRSADVPDVSGRIARTKTDVGAVLPGAKLEVSPADALWRHQAVVQRLTLTLTIFSIPILGLIGYFVFLVAGLIVQRQSNEIAVLRSRGTSHIQVLIIYLLEAVLLGIVALGIGLVLGQFAALLMTWTRSFLDLTPRENLPIGLTAQAWQRGVQMLGIVLFASLIPAFGAARYTIISYKNERARAMRRPFWQRAFLDVLLLVPVYYGYQQLKERGTIAVLDTSGVGDPFSNPLLLLVPTLYIFALALITIRLFPLVMAAAAWLFMRLPGVAAVTALRYLARTPRAYTSPLLLLILTLSLATFTASMASTLDHHLVDQIYYDTGGDINLFDLGQGTQDSGPSFQQEGDSTAAKPENAQPKDALQEAKWFFLPVTDYLTIPGVTAATRVTHSKVDVRVSGQSTPAQFVGIDRVTFPDVVHWRADYANESLGAVLNRLADDPASVLVSRDFAAQRGLGVGDKLELTMNDLGDPQKVPVVIAGFLNLFPTVYPDAESGPIIVGNIEYAFEQQGGQYPYDVWLRLQNGTARKAVDNGALELNLKIFDNGYAPEEITAERARPERQGLFGLLSVGFVAAAFLTVLGFLFYAVLSFQRRFVEIGTLRAIGLTVRQLGALLACEQAMIIGAGMLAGTLIGVTASRLFIPFLQVRGGQHPQTPPFVVQIAWNQIAIIYVVFGAILLFAVLIMLVLLRRMKLFQAVKLGETT
jgi:putative ABC transport system permease protein